MAHGASASVVPDPQHGGWAGAAGRPTGGGWLLASCAARRCFPAVGHAGLHEDGRSARHTRFEAASVASPGRRGLPPSGTTPAFCRCLSLSASRWPVTLGRGTRCSAAYWRSLPAYSPVAMPCRAEPWLRSCGSPSTCDSPTRGGSTWLKRHGYGRRSTTTGSAPTCLRCSCVTRGGRAARSARRQGRSRRPCVRASASSVGA